MKAALIMILIFFLMTNESNCDSRRMWPPLVEKGVTIEFTEEEKCICIQTCLVPSYLLFLFSYLRNEDLRHIKAWPKA